MKLEELFFLLGCPHVKILLSQLSSIIENNSGISLLPYDLAS
jgi:hypothetical protein